MLSFNRLVKKGIRALGFEVKRVTKAPNYIVANQDTPPQKGSVGPERCFRKQITIICVAYKRYEPIHVLIRCFLAQTLQNFKLIIIHDGFDERMDELLSFYKSNYPGFIHYLFTEKRYNDFGHSLRDLGIKMVDTEYVLITNDDNYYSPKFLENMFAPINLNPSKKPDIVFCDMVHGHENPGVKRQPANDYFETEPRRYFIDIGCFIAKSNLAIKVGFSLLIPKFLFFWQKNYASCSKTFANSGIIIIVFSFIPIVITWLPKRVK